LGTFKLCTGINNTGCIFCHDISDDVDTGINYNGSKFASGVVDTGGKSELEGKIYINVNSATQRCPKKLFLINAAFFHSPPVSTTPVVHLEL
jgi:hypothetical protein